MTPLSRIPITVFLAANTWPLVESTVSYGGHTYESMPSHFGMDWSPPPRSYQAHLQFFAERAKLCEEGFEVDELEGLVVPNDTLPVALLVERGDCSFEDKAAVAMQAYPTVNFMVIYDDQPSKNLVSMRETNNDHGITLGMLFVNYNAGMALREVLKNQTEEVLAGGGPRINLNGLDPLLLHDPSLKDFQTWVLISMGGILTFITVFGALLILVQLGIIPVNGAGQIILSQDAIRRSRRLLTREEVNRFQPGGDLHGKSANSDEVETQPSDELPTDDEEDDTADAPNAVDVNASIDPEEDHSCAVCLDELGFGEDEGSSTMCLPCGHNFHLDCIVPWLTERHATCPLCKFDLLEFIMDLEEKTPSKGSRMSTSLLRLKQQARRLMGWSPIRSSDSQSEGAASTGEDSERINDVSSDVDVVTPI